MLFLKFGQKEHLQQLKTGVVHFRPLSSFKEDTSKARGDRLEASLLVDLSHPIVINGTDYTRYIKEVRQSYDGYDSILSFSVAKLDYNNCHMTQNGLFTVNNDFIEEMKQFGPHVLIFSADSFLTGLHESLSVCKCNYKHKSIFYCDKTDHVAIAKHFSDQEKLHDPYEYCFIKDYTPYAKQNEWRFIIHDINDEFPIEDTGGVNIRTSFRTEIPIFETSMLSTLFVSEEYLK